MTPLQRVRILPLLVLVATLALFVRAGEFAAGIEDAGIAFAQKEPAAGAEVQAPAETKTPAGDSGKGGEEPSASPAMDKPAAELSADGEEPSEKPMEPSQKPSEAAAGKTGTAEPAKPAEGTAEKKDADAAVADSVEKPAGEAGSEKADWKDAGESDFNYSPVREELYKDLAARREALEGREKALATREALLEVAERELDQKIREMTAVRNEIEGLMKKQSEEELQRIASLVKIYEGMKPGDAARIFDTLDMDVLIAVMARMSERKSGPILAEMAPERARAVTIMLAQQKQLPQIPPQ